MSLAQKFTWGDFLKKHPEFKKKKIKRTSAEADKAFQAAFKEFAKDFLKKRQAKLKKEEETVTKKKNALVARLKSVDGKKWHLKSKKLNQRIGRFDAYLVAIKKQEEKTAKLAKSV